MKVIITPRAQSDMEAISKFIAAENPARALTYIDEIIDRCLTLADNPERFPLAERLASKGVRKLNHGNYLIFYRVYRDRITVARVLHAATDYAARFSGR